ncbi:acyltransferase family protein [Kineococcus sp. DHX-1]|uniref:acyltransferase family protein n=1 Tax=Kineococcus sp. DHX-1 TaxID=3349638 RepID=UPI0036D23728
MRGLACLLLVAYHVRGGDPGSGLQLPTDNPWSAVVDAADYLRMPLFSFLSGWVYATRPLSSGSWSFVRVKARRLLVPLLVVGTLFGVVQLLVGAGDGLPPWYAWHLVPLAHFWFLESIFWVAVTVALLDRWGVLRRPQVLVGLVLVALVVGPSVAVPHNLLGLQTATFLLPFYLAGVGALRFEVRSTGPRFRVLLVAVTVVLVGRAAAGLLGELPRLPSQSSAVASLLGVCLCLCLVLTKVTVRPLVVLGAFSFTVYTCHVFGTAASRMLLDAAGVQSVSLQMVAGIVAGLTVGVGAELVARRHAWTGALVLGRRWPRRPAASPQA